MSSYYSCWSYANDQARFIETKLFFKQISFNLAIFGKDEGDFRERKKLTFNRNYNTYLWILESNSVNHF